ncbi:hypothetical protein MMSR116_17575 [Methylobacterium mesophilicum SR1.6/6]|uniref:Uncharacterized protein n=1 Tax=Methylobacterium mesophilicum SR1.6/6 TaxID=908290 RepID=A0A6B9FLL1_9HYPH|nr:hypothetical protein [Methylobacterium mesophilicum]QGY03501.1 hypothetical protein MMSR116_17575 [Methylobacterium mesophilicum SR1.6/6]
MTIAESGGFVTCTLEAESVKALKDAGIVGNGAKARPDGTMIRDEYNALLARRQPSEGTDAAFQRLLSRDPAALEAAHARVVKARRRAAAPFTPKAELAALARAAVAERDHLIGRGA